MPVHFDALEGKVHMKNGLVASLVGAVILAALVFWSVQQTAGVARVIESQEQRITKCEGKDDELTKCVSALQADMSEVRTDLRWIGRGLSSKGMIPPRPENDR